MKGRWFQAETDGRLGIELEPETDDERLLLKLFYLQNGLTKKLGVTGLRCSGQGQDMPYESGVKLAPSHTDEATVLANKDATIATLRAALTEALDASLDRVLNVERIDQLYKLAKGE